MSERPIQPESQLIAGPSRSNDDALVNDSREETGVSSMIVPLEIRKRGPNYIQTNKNLRAFVNCIWQ